MNATVVVVAVVVIALVCGMAAWVTLSFIDTLDDIEPLNHWKDLDL